MKIIGNKKDYYDYVCGEYGIDQNVVFDRREFKLIDKYLFDSKSNIFNGDVDYVYALWFGNEVRYISYDKDKKEWFVTNNPNDVINNLKIFYSNIFNSTFSRSHNDSIIEFKIVSFSRFGHYNSVYSFNDIILRDIKIVTKLIPAKDVWMGIYSYLSSLKDKNIEDNRSDILKLESAGFDKKTSFRNVK